MSINSSRAHGMALLFALSLAAMADAACTTQLQTKASPCPVGSTVAGASLCLGDVRTDVFDGSRVSVHATIANISDALVNGKVWWVLAPPGPGAVWDRAVFTSDIDQRDYQIGETIAANWEASVALPDGFYDLALIVHQLSPGGSESHADARSIGPIHIAAPLSLPWIIRHGSVGGPVLIEAVSGLVLSPGRLTTPTGRVVVSNSSAKAAAISAHLEIRLTFSGWEDRWWQAAILASTDSSADSVGAMAAKTMNVDASRFSSSMLGAYPNEELWLVVDAGGTLSDEVLLGGPETFQRTANVALIRRGPPSGPVEITDIATPVLDSTRGTLTATVKVSNLTAKRQRVLVFWFVAAQNDLQPWNTSVEKGLPLAIQLNAWSTQVVTIAGDHRGQSGQWQLSAWAHYEQAPSLPTQQTDALWYARPIALT